MTSSLMDDWIFTMKEASTSLLDMLRGQDQPQQQQQQRRRRKSRTTQKGQPKDPSRVHLIKRNQEYHDDVNDYYYDNDDDDNHYNRRRKNNNFNDEDDGQDDENHDADDDASDDEVDEERVSLVEPSIRRPMVGLRKNRIHPLSSSSAGMGLGSGSRHVREGRQRSSASSTGSTATTKRKMRTFRTRLNAWLSTRLGYLSLSIFSAVITFLILRRRRGMTKTLHWQQFDHLLHPHMKGDHCYHERRRHSKAEQCSCPNPSVALAGTGTNAVHWTSYHNQLVKAAKDAPKNLDVVFVGDDIVERWQGTTELGTKILGADMERPFQSRFVKKKGGHLEGLALGASSDTGPNMLWHIQNGMIDDLNPKLWFISIGSNDLFEEKCDDRFVVASILNVVKAIADRKPDAHFIIHGILPRKDSIKSKAGFLEKKWRYAQKINTHIRKFCEHSRQLFYMQAGTLFLKETSKEWKGRNIIDQNLLEDGMYPTKKGMEVWGDYIVKRIKQILQDIEDQKQRDSLEQSRRLQSIAR